MIEIIGDGYLPNQVIFYDGANDINHMCRSEINELPSHSYEEIIKNKLSKDLGGRKFNEEIAQGIIKFILAPYARINSELNTINLVGTANSKETYNCHIDKIKSKSIAKHLVNNWYTAYLLSKQNNFQFLAILHPNIFTSNVKFDYFSKSEKNHLPIYEEQMNAVYTEILLEMNRVCIDNKEFCKSLVNASDWLKNEENIFIDFAHVTSRGNEIIAKEIAKF